MYKLNILPIAKNDMDNIVYYIANDLKNISAARKLSKKFIECAKSILDFPYGLPAYTFSYKLENEYRCIKINNFLMFYTINEEMKVITIVRVLYKKMDIKNILE